MALSNLSPFCTYCFTPSLTSHNHCELCNCCSTIPKASWLPFNIIFHSLTVTASPPSNPRVFSSSPSYRFSASYQFITGRPIEAICDINEGKELWKVAIRVHHRWSVLINNKEHFEMIFVDKAAGIDDPLEFPWALDQLLNLEMEFKVKWLPRWNNCSVISILRDEPFIRQLKAPWDVNEEVVVVPSITSDPLQVKESIDEAKTCAPEDCVKETDLEITSKHNLNPTTPIGKKDFLRGSSESTTSDEFCDGQLSSNKLRKTIKLEKND